MSSVVISGDSSGTVTLTVPSAAGTNTATLPAATGTVMVSGNMPAFSAYLSANTSALSAGVYTKITCNTEEFDTNNNYASGTFTPTVAGYYQITAASSPSAFTGNYYLTAIYKNGVLYKNGNNFPTSNAGGPTSLATSLIYLNGSTDYVEMYVIANGTPIVYGVATHYTYINGCLVRAA